MSSEPPLDCQMCERLVNFRQANQAAYPDYFNAPVPSFGSKDASLLIVGLAPGLKGANRTGRPFTGDFAGDLLYATLVKFGFANGAYDKRPDDRLDLVNCRITNAVRCVPPQNKPVGAEEKACRPFLISTLEEMANLKAILVLGSLAHGSTLSALGLKKSAFKFGHGAVTELESGVKLISSYHCSRYNTNTGKLTTEMFEDAIRLCRDAVG